MHPPHLPKVLTDGLGASVQYLAILFLLFPALAYGYAAFKQRRLIWRWRDLREALAPGHIYQTHSVRFDIAMFWVQIFVILPPLTYVGALYTAQQFAGLLHARAGAPAVSLGAGHPIAATVIQLIASEILGTFGAYIFHYAGHKVPLFWALHQVHHSTDALSPFTAVRGHPVDTVLGVMVGEAWRALVVGVALYFTGGAFTPTAISLFAIMAMASLVQAALNHTHVSLCYGWFNRLWVGPTFHQIHHSAEPRHRDKNLGAAIPVWDWVFGTLYLPQPGEVFTLGLNEDSLGEANPHNSFRGYMIEPMIAFAAELRRLMGGALKRQGRRSLGPAALGFRSAVDQNAIQTPLR
jgi:sterol desaturase/sphingolipid hydroxylase (fatty acid hydroxylase superfamily)